MTWPAALQALDERIMHAARGSPAFAVPAFYVITIVGGGWLLFLLLPLAGWKATRAFAIFAGVCVGVTSGLVEIAKKLVERPRPCDALVWCFPIDITSPGGFSFPSGHAAGSFAFAGFVVLWSRTLERRGAAVALSALALVYASLVAWSRIVLGVHYPSDVLGGAILGFSIGAAFAVALGKFRERRPATTS